VTGLGLAAAGWAAFLLAAAIALRALHAAAIRGEAVARACHEVRGPLTAARLGLESNTASPAPGRLRAIEVELARATVALDELQAVERVELAPEEGLVDVRTWLADSVEAWRPVASARGAEIRLDWRGPKAAVVGRRSRLAQVTGNLIANAIDHGRGPVEVRGWAEGQAVVVEVTDAGSGLPRAVSVSLQSDRGGWRGRGGLGGREWGKARANAHGHGLRIAQAVAEAHGGRLAAGESARGARLVLTLPRA
jgi:signal transduction histidine kinase